MSNTAEHTPTDATVEGAGSPSSPPGPGSTPVSLPEEAEDSTKDTPSLTAADVTTAAQLALLKATYQELETAKKAALEKETAERKKREAQPGWNRKDEFAYLMNERESSKLFSKMWALGLPHPQPLQWALVELSADFRSAHSGDNQLAKFQVAARREWFDDGRTLISEFSTRLYLQRFWVPLTSARLKVYILMRFGASKKVNEDGIVSYMSLESVHNLWILCRHLVSKTFS